MSTPILKGGALALAAILLPTTAFAHPGHGDAVGFLHGLQHPVTGIDHMLAMVMVGIFAVQRGGRAVWVLPLTFMLVMAAGGAIGMAGLTLPRVETHIAMSVVLIGAVVALQVAVSTGIAATVTGFFALFHGHAHGTEMPVDGSAFEYAAGFLVATALLHAVGIAIGIMIARAGTQPSLIATRSAGGIAAVAGVGILMNGMLA